MKKYALVTGASRGIGEAIALTLAEDGFEVIIHYSKNKKRAESVKKTIEKNGAKAHLTQCDLHQEAAIRKLFADVSKITSKLDLVVNNAGVSFPHSIEGYSTEKVRATFNVNFLAIFIITQLSLPFLKKSKNPQIINIASRLGKEKVLDKASAYSASKAAVIQFTKSCALEFGDYRIRVNAVCPGLTNTEMNYSFMKNRENAERVNQQIPLGRIAEPRDIANIVSFLASDRASYINGESIGVNGGSILT